MTNDDELDDDDDDVVCCLDNGRVGGKFVLCTQNFVLAHTKFCVSLHKILCDSYHRILCGSYTKFCVRKRCMRFLVMRKESIATSVTASATLCTVHMYLISESLNKVNLSVLLLLLLLLLLARSLAASRS